MPRTPALLAVPLLTLALATPADARTAECDALIEGEAVTITYDTADPAWASRRERLFARGRTCPAAVVIAHQLEDFPPEARQVFCTTVDPATGHGPPSLGARDAYGRCVGPSRTCEMVNTTRDAALDLVGLAEITEAEPGRSRWGSALTAVTHWSGATILSGNAGTVANLMTSVGGTVGTALGSPMLLAGAAASVVVVGGAVWLCSEAE
ncbi:MAG: hypothetical protein ACXIUV_04325 [Alkalilacustris sp.]